MTEREPPYASDVKARGWRFELDMERVRRSDTWSLAPADIRPWLLMLWTVAWEELPCGSLPDDDEVIAAKLGMPEKLFARHARVMRRGWWRASDGRLYHETISERVLQMLDKRVKDAGRARDARERKAKSQASHAHVTRDAHVRPGGVQVEFDTQNPEPSTEKEDISEPTVPHPPAAADGQKRRASVPCPYHAIVDAYHQALPTLPRVRLVEQRQRQVAMRRLWGWVLSSRKSDGTKRANTADEALEWLRGYFARAADNDFLMGRTPRSGEHAAWQCDFDFLLTDRGMRQVIEKTREMAT